MPLYEFECIKCGVRIEILKAKYYDDKASEICPVCKKCQGPTKRVFSVPLVLYNGYGFFVTDSKPKSASGDDTPSRSGSLIE